jgi:N-acetylmuramoyl-L-alanine amidase
MKLSAALLALFISLFFLPSLVLGAEVPIKLYMNEKILNPEVAPRLVSGNTLVPVAIIAKELGSKVTWNEGKRQVTVVQGETNLLLTIDKRDIVINGKNQTLEVAPVIIDGSTLLPVRIIGEKMGVQFNWDGPTNSVHMYKKAAVEPNIQEPKPVIPENQPVAEKPSVTDKQPVPQVTPVTDTADHEDESPEASPLQTSIPTIPVDQTIHLLQSIELSGTDFIVKTKDGEIKPVINKLSSPNRIVFDFPNTALDEPLKKLLVGTSGELASTHPLIQKIRFSDFNKNPATVRVILDLKDQADYKLIPSKIPNQFTATIKQHTIKVVIDAGHGAKDPGALSLTGKKEKDFTLAMAKKVTDALSKDNRIEVLMTRTEDIFVELDDRVKFAEDAQVDLFLSIHGNKINKASVSGVETYYNRPESLSFANAIHNHVVPATGFSDRGVRVADYRVIKKTTMPAVLVEVGYLSNKGNEASMYKDAFQSQVAVSLATAIKEYLNLK